MRPTAEEGASAGAYGRSGVSQASAESAVQALVRSLERIDTGKPSRVVQLPGHYASVLRLDDRRGLALSTDTVGTKMVIAERLGRFDTIGIDCVAMNVNDVISVGAEPIAMLDFILTERADPRICGELGIGLARGAELAGIEIPGGEIAQVGDIVSGQELGGSCVGLVDLDAIVTGASVSPGDPVIGLPSSGLHSNGYTLARAALAEVALDDERLERPLGDVLLEPTEIYVRPTLELLRSPVDVRGLAHITGDGLDNLLRLEAEVGYEIDDPLPAPPIFGLIQELGRVSDQEMREVFNMGCGFCCVVAAPDEAQALELLRAHYPNAKRIGRATDRAGEVAVVA
jgi:phosphoribosylformylglycinamidine cyclo-ligase